MTTGTLPDTAYALAAVGLPNPGGRPEAIRAHADAFRELATELKSHADDLASLVRQSELSWAGDSADSFRSAAGADAHLLADVARAAAVIGNVHEVHAEQQSKALVIIKELAIQIAALLAMLAAVALFPPLFSVIEMQLAALAATAGRFITWIADLLAAIVRFLVQARVWISQISNLVWRTESFSFAYGRMAFEGLRDAAVDVLASLTARGISHKPLDITMLWTALGSGVAGGVFGAVEGSGIKKALTESGEIRRSADGSPQFVSFGDRTKQWADSLGRKEKSPQPAGSIPTSTDIANALTGSSETLIGRSGLTGATGTGRLGQVDPLDGLLLTRARARELGLRGLPGEGKPLAAAVAGAQAGRESAAMAQQQAQRQLRDALARREAAERSVRSQSHAAAQSEARVWTTDTLRQIPALSGPERRSAAEQLAARARARLEQHRLQGIVTGRDATVREVRAAQRTAAEASAAASTAEQALSAAAARYQAWQDFADAGRSMRQNLPMSQSTTAMWRTNPWREGYVTQYGQATGEGAAKLKPGAWTTQDIGGLADRALNAIGAPKSWREIAVYETGKGFLKGSAANAIATGITYQPGKTSPLAWVGVPIAGAGGAMRDLTRGPLLNRLIPDRSIEDIVFRVGLSGLGKQSQSQIMQPIAAPS
ncbi:WXG100 family type VII secretion target [Kitasatospora indigofera]|uniref:WXG100 family type VII secretion target n=1 Tax=Kitasatospora indigofera TaxID=67307 RepID=UPI0036C8900A